MKKAATLALAVFLSTLSVTAHAEETLNGAGATFPAPLYSAWAYEYNKVTGTKLNYQSIGSGGGQRQIVERTVDFGASDDTLSSEKLAKDKLLQFPAVIGGITPVVNIPGIKTGELQLDASVHCKIFMGDIKFWDDAQIKKLNPKANLPHNEITVVHRSDGSGTTAIFTHYLAETCPAWKDKVGEGKAVSWPIAGATFILLAKDKKESNIRTVKFFDWAFVNGDAKAKELVYIPLPKSLKSKVKAYWKANGIQ